MSQVFGCHRDSQWHLPVEGHTLPHFHTSTLHEIRNCPHIVNRQLQVPEKREEPRHVADPTTAGAVRERCVRVHDLLRYQESANGIPQTQLGHRTHAGEGALAMPSWH